MTQSKKLKASNVSITAACDDIDHMINILQMLIRLKLMSSKCQNCYSLTCSYQRTTVKVIIHADLRGGLIKELMTGQESHVLI